MAVIDIDASAHQEIPLVDLSSFFQPDSPEIIRAREEKVREISKACEEWGFFQVSNHGLDGQLIQDALKVSREFFSLPLEEKMKLYLPAGASPVPIGFCYNSGLANKVEKKEHMFFFAEDGELANKGSGYAQYNVWPETPQSYKSVVKERLLKETQKTAIFLLGLISQSLGLPKEFLYEHYEDKLNALIMLHYPPSELDVDEIGLSKHQDGNILSVVAQSEIEGLQVLKDGKWITIKPLPNCLVVNVGDIVQVWSNDRYKSVLHRVVNNKQGTRYSFSFSCVPGASTKVSPLPQFTTEIQEAARYRDFVYGEYMMFRFENKKIGGPNSEEITIKYYAI